MICLSVLSEGQIKILNMSNNAGLPMNTTFVGLETEFVSICGPPIHRRPQYNGMTTFFSLAYKTHR